ncbi:MAG: ATP synthase F0 subunit C [Bacteriovoracia bacterium]
MNFLKNKKSVLFTVACLAMMVSSVAMANDAPAAGAKEGIGALGAALAIGLAAFGCGLGQGRSASAALEGMARNPQANLQGPMIIAMALTESLVIFSFIIALIKY